jgi:K+-sensing histidine kinase KdpD
MITMQASCVSHDMRAPLSAISSIVENILQKKGVSKRIVSLLRPVRCASKILSVQVDNLLDYNLVSKLKFKINPQKVDIKELITQVTEAMAPQAEMTRVKLTVKVSIEVPTLVMIDPDRF